MTAELCCCAASYQPIVYGLNSFAVPASELVAPPLEGTPIVDQLRTPGALLGKSGPTPLFRAGLKLAPDPAGNAKQLVHALPKPLRVLGAGTPTEIVAGMDDAMGVRLSSPHGLKSGVKFERSLPWIGESSAHS